MNNLIIIALFLSILSAQNHFKTEAAEEEHHQQQQHQQKKNEKHWTYEEPQNWEGMCQMGQRQSPIDIRTDWFNDEKTPKITFANYRQKGKVTMANNGHSVVISGFDKWAEQQPNIADGGFGHKYMLLQFHFHWSQNGNGSEHTVNGAHYDAEVHLVHVKEGLTFSEALELSDGIAVLGIFFKIGYDGSPMASLENGLNKVTNKDASVEIEDYTPNELLPRDLDTFFRYNGSLTTPDCNESVVWTLFAKAVPISSEQMQLLRAINGHDGKSMRTNVRPVQKFNGKTQKNYDKYILDLFHALSGPI